MKYNVEKLNEINTALYEGRKEGLEWGLKETKKREIKIIKNMVDKKIDYKTIAEVLEKSIKEVKRLSNL